MQLLGDDKMHLLPKYVDPEEDALVIEIEKKKAQESNRQGESQTYWMPDKLVEHILIP